MNRGIKNEILYVYNYNYQKICSKQNYQKKYLSNPWKFYKEEKTL
jgi:hypothetical protein